MWKTIYVEELEICTGRIFQSGRGPARMATISARPEVKKKISARARPEREIKISARARPARKGNWNFGPSQARPETKYKTFNLWF